MVLANSIAVAMPDEAINKLRLFISVDFSQEFTNQRLGSLHFNQAIALLSFHGLQGRDFLLNHR